MPRGAGRNLTAKRAKELLATVRPRDIAGRTRRQLAVDLVADLASLDRKLKDLDKRLKAAVAATGTTLTDIKGVGTATAAMILGEVGDVRRFPTRHHFATYTGVAPIEVSSGEVATPPTVPGREPPAQPRAAHHRAVQQALRPPRRRLLRQEDRRRQRQEGRPAQPETTPV